MNITLTGLTLAHYLINSPMHTNTLANKIGNHINFEHVCISRSFSNLLYSFSNKQNNQQIFIQNCRFSLFLDRVLFITQKPKPKINFFSNENFAAPLNITSSNQNNQEFLLSNSIIVDNCFFYSITGPKYGGCIYTNEHLSVTNSKFGKCRAHTGGCIYCTDSSLAFYSNIFDSCISNHMCSCFYQISTDIRNSSLILLFTQFEKCNSKNLFGIFYRKASNDCIISNSNISNCGAKNCVGSFEVSLSSFCVQFCHIFKSYAKVHNGCLVCRDNENFSIEYTLFIECEHHSSVSEAGSILLAYTLPYQSKVHYVSIIDSVFDESYSISIISEFGLNFEHCYFSFAQENEINPISNNLCFFSNTEFNCDRCEKFKNAIDSKISLSNRNDKGRIHDNIFNGKFDNNFLANIFNYKLQNDSFSTRFFEKVEKKLGMSKKTTVFFMIYIVFLIIGFILLKLFNFLMTKYPSLCVINRGVGFELFKTPKAIL